MHRNIKESTASKFLILVQWFMKKSVSTKLNTIRYLQKNMFFDMITIEFHRIEISLIMVIRTDNVAEETPAKTERT